MNLKEIREEKNITQQSLADAISRDRSLIGKIENGYTLPSVETAKAIGKILDIDWTLFFEDVGKRTSYFEDKEV